jgi:uncharacterized protein YunC (DUF1805 family)
MITTSYVTIGSHGMDGVCVPTANNSVLIIQAPKGLLGSKYISVERAKNVETLEEMLTAEVCAVSNAAQTLGIKPGMTGEDALMMMA